MAVTIHAIKHARVGITMRLVTTRLAVVRKGKQYRRITRTAVLAEATRRVATDASGRYTNDVRLAYATHQQLRATLIVSVRVQCATATRAVPVTVWPLPQRQSPGHGHRQRR